MAVKPVLTTGDIAAHCHVSQETVVNWIRRGQLKAYATPGRHRRVHISDFRDFLSEHGMPPMAPATRRQRVLVVDADVKIVKLWVDFLSREADYELASASDGFEAGILTATFRPDLLILDLVMPNIDGFRVCETIRTSPDTRHIRLLVVPVITTGRTSTAALRSGADCCMAKPLAVRELKLKVEELLQGPTRVRQKALGRGPVS